MALCWPIFFLDGRVKVMKGGSIEIDDKILDFKINKYYNT